MVMEIIISVILLFVGIAVLVLIHVCIVGRAFGRGYENGDNLGPRSSSNGTKRVSNEDLKNLPCFDYKAVDGEGITNPVVCVVCLENFKAGENCRLLPNCSHFFHVQCIDSWLLKTPICPICRTSVNLRIGTILSEEIGVSVAVEVELT